MHFSDFVGSSSQRVSIGTKNASLQGRLSSVARTFKQHCKHHSSTLHRMAHGCFIGWLFLGRLYARMRIMRVLLIGLHGRVWWPSWAAFIDGVFDSLMSVSLTPCQPMPSKCQANVKSMHNKRGSHPSKCKPNVNLMPSKCTIRFSSQFS